MADLPRFYPDLRAALPRHRAVPLLDPAVPSRAAAESVRHNADFRLTQTPNSARMDKDCVVRMDNTSENDQGSRFYRAYSNIYNFQSTLY